MSLDLRDVLRDVAPDPSRPVDVGAVYRRGRALRRQRSIAAAALALAVVVGAVGVTLSVVRAPDRPFVGEVPEAPSGNDVVWRDVRGSMPVQTSELRKLDGADDLVTWDSDGSTVVYTTVDAGLTLAVAVLGTGETSTVDLDAAGKITDIRAGLDGRYHVLTRDEDGALTWHGVSVGADGTTTVTSDYLGLADKVQPMLWPTDDGLAVGAPTSPYPVVHLLTWGDDRPEPIEADPDDPTFATLRIATNVEMSDEAGPRLEVRVSSPIAATRSITLVGAPGKTYPANEKLYAIVWGDDVLVPLVQWDQRANSNGLPLFLRSLILVGFDADGTTSVLVDDWVDGFDENPRPPPARLASDGSVTVFTFDGPVGVVRRYAPR